MLLAHNLLLLSLCGVDQTVRRLCPWAPESGCLTLPGLRSNTQATLPQSGTWSAPRSVSGQGCAVGGALTRTSSSDEARWLAPVISCSAPVPSHPNRLNTARRQIKPSSSLLIKPLSGGAGSSPRGSRLGRANVARPWQSYTVRSAGAGPGEHPVRFFQLTLVASEGVWWPEACLQQAWLMLPRPWQLRSSEGLHE